MLKVLAFSVKYSDTNTSLSWRISPSTGLKATLWNRISPSVTSCEWKTPQAHEREIPLCSFPHICSCLSAVLLLRIELRALGQIAEGEELTVAYVDYLNLSEERQRLLKTQYYFDCTCEHCKERIKDDIKLAGREVDGVKVRSFTLGALGTDKNRRETRDAAPQWLF